MFKILKLQYLFLRSEIPIPGAFLLPSASILLISHMSLQEKKSS